MLGKSLDYIHIKLSFVDTFTQWIILGICLTALAETADIKCVKDGEGYPVGTFIPVSDPCKTCNCKDDGTVTCWLKFCPKPKCGKNLFRISDDGCCKECARICDGKNQPKLDCWQYRYYYPEDSCIATQCGCFFEKQLVPRGKVGNPCDNCRCQANGKVWCKRGACPSEKLHCVDPTYDENCTYICPNGTILFRT
ncbi:brorin-like isoform X2 [Mercenaria mercenaria]|uniref:brorin-like isoform X2 n=1 Tax=Mercenaria mercenaria TaxID=6596 RepID=UPI00234E5BBB|nr:brorin-like isoform X2 [Mercenaria mercenaria]